ncbi:hypothetical protein H5410_061278 [Solanum commersonii]|uniref:RNA helicase n=1 Tax=Solanum commersonii TaxID=4109 RepID=A0A9J5W8N3_SOLCO|nr:hypothetical protein H5410_061278 [Solanum commersonii]
MPEVSILIEEYKVALDKAINLAFSDDDLDPLLDLISSEGGPKVFNYQHSFSTVTPLIVFGGEGRVGDICMLLSFGVDCHLRANHGKTALDWAEQENQTEAIEIIKEHMEKSSSSCCRKIVLSTNITKTAVTIDDVVYVIDSGRMKEIRYDSYNNVSTLQSSWVSKASAKQREGRARQCQPGICYHLYSKLQAASLPDFQVPEIKRIHIEELCLQGLHYSSSSFGNMIFVKLLNPDCKIEEFLQKTLDPSIYETIRNAIIILQDIGGCHLMGNLQSLEKG